MRRACIFLMLLTLLPLCAGCAAADEGAGTQLIALNIGKADCLLLQTQGKAYLIDTGWERTSAAMLELLRRNGVTHLDGVFLSHCDRDHYGGLQALAQSDIQVDAWYAAAIYYDIPSAGHPMIAAAALRGQEVSWLRAGDEIRISDQAAFRVIGPLTQDTQNENNNSLILHVQTADGSILLTGDMKLDEEYALLEAGVVPACDVLKIPFHGDNSATSDSFLQAVSPKAALICTATAQIPEPAGYSVCRHAGLHARRMRNAQQRDGRIQRYRMGYARLFRFRAPEAEQRRSYPDTAEQQRAGYFARWLDAVCQPQQSLLHPARGHGAACQRRIQNRCARHGKACIAAIGCKAAVAQIALRSADALRCDGRAGGRHR